MNFALTIPLADSWTMHGGGGWWIVGAALMMLFMGGMMWMMMRGMGSRSTRDSSAPWDRFARTGSPIETLERRLAEGEISIEEYRERRAALVNGTGEPAGDDGEEQLTAPGAGEERRQS